VAIPTSYHEHRIIAHNGGVAESVQGLGAGRLDLLPLVLLSLQRAAPKVIIPCSAVIPSEDIHGSIEEHNCVVCSWRGRLACSLNARPSLSI